MPWAGEIKVAEERMYQAVDALLSDVESGEPYNAERRHALLATLKRAQDEFFAAVAQLHE